MARIRTVKPEFWTSEQVAECSTITRLLFIGMWNFCDDGGNHPASLKSLKMQIFPSDDIQVSEIDSMVKELINHGLLAQYTVNNKDYWHVLGWHHQKIDKPNIKHPPYLKSDSQPFDDYSTTTSQPIPPVRESKVREGKVMDINKKESASEEFQKQDASHLYVTPTRRTFDMFAEWQPEPKSWAAYLKMSSHVVKPEQFTNYTLLEFIRSNVGKGEKMESEWQKFYVNAIARGYIKPEGQVVKPTYQPKQQTIDEEDKPYDMSNEVVIEKMPVVSKEEKVRQLAIIQRMMNGEE